MLLEREGASLLPIPLLPRPRPDERSSSSRIRKRHRLAMGTWRSGNKLLAFSIEGAAARPPSFGVVLGRLYQMIRSLLLNYAPDGWLCLSPRGLNGGATIPIVPAPMQRQPF